MILTGDEIHREVLAGRIHICPYRTTQLNPVSYNYGLGEHIVEINQENVGSDRTLLLPKDGLVLSPRKLYLGSTVEEIGSDFYVPSLIGRSSVGRLGLFVQLAADLGNIGAVHKWTLELYCVQPIRIYPRMLIGQVTFWAAIGAITHYNGLYAKYSSPTGNLHGKLVEWGR